MRSLPAGLQAALESGVVNPWYGVAMHLDSGVLRFWTGIGDKTIGADTYLGTSTADTHIMDIGPIATKSVVEAETLEINFTGIDSSFISKVMTEPYQRRKCTIYLGMGNLAPVLIKSAIIDQIDINDEGKSCTVGVKITDVLRELNRATNWLLTEESHKTRLAAGQKDTGFSYVTDLQGKDFPWGREND